MKKNRLLPGVLLLFSLCLPAPGQKPEMFARIKGGKGALTGKEVHVPFTLKGSHYLFVDVRLNNNPQIRPFLIDSGGVTTLDTALARKYNLTLSPLNAETSMTTLERLDLAGASITDFRPFVSDFADKFKAQGRRAGMELTGMLGCDALRFFRVLIDYGRSRLVLTTDTTPLTATGDDQALLPMEILIPYHPCVTVDFPGFSLPGRIDTGLHYAVVLPLVHMEKLDPGQKTRCIKSRGNFALWPDTAIEHNFLYVFPEIRIGRFVLEDQPVLFADLPAPLGTDFLLLGKHFLENFLTTLDFQARKVRLEKAPSGRDLSLAFSAGLHLVKEVDRVKINGLWEGSPADRAGLKIDQAVLSLNGRQTADLDNAAILDILMDRGVKEVVLEVKDGKDTRRVVLKKENLFK